MSIDRVRSRDLGVAPGNGTPGPTNTIVDVPGVRVGQVTILEGTRLHTGVTAIVPDAVDVPGGRMPAGLFVGNGYGKLVGATQLVELGEIETPILLTGTLSAFRAADALVSYVLSNPGNESVESLNPVVGETNDGFLSDIRSRPITEAHVLEALRTASTDPVEQGCVGAGTGTAALGFKGGIGSASRVVDLGEHGSCTLGVLAQTNFSGTLTVHGVPITPQEGLSTPLANDAVPQGNSCMLIVAIDAGLDARQLTRVATRAVFGMAQVGSDFAQGSGDYAIAFDTGPTVPVPDAQLNPVFAAVQEAVAEAVLDSLFLATTTTGFHGHTKHAVPLDFVLEKCAAAGVLNR
ncbi:MAG TPA: P1 family peptidase [Flexivirga sp.]|uniref:P1 family peptidase n=1 Tax=Flexivirga sp. TaxID=1962927 RepID=UPI002CE3C29F|nr:P1 family peptidase [Flexivirga sp.]HWC24568.1 P1 family peptidase [Flexivirga sp.]